MAGLSLSGVPIPKFVHACGTLWCELRGPRGYNSRNFKATTRTIQPRKQRLRNNAARQRPCIRPVP